MTDTTDASLTDAEKRRILRERRQAKMAKGNATNRLNTILSQGAAVPTTVTSVLDKEQEPATTTGLATSTGISTHEPHHDEDPEIQDITSIVTQPVEAPTPPIGSETPEDIDAIFRKVFQQASPKEGASGENDPMAQFMKMFSEGAAGLEGGESADFLKSPAQDASGMNDVYAYNAYQQNLWKFRFLIVRYVVTAFNFFYHFLTIPDQLFHASSHSYVRGLVSETPLSGFITWFFTTEVLIVATYYMISVKTGVFHTKHENSFIIKAVSLGAMVLPQLAQLKPYVSRALAYYDLIGIVLGDLSLVVVLFGLLSFIR